MFHHKKMMRDTHRVLLHPLCPRNQLIRLETLRRLHFLSRLFCNVFRLRIANNISFLGKGVRDHDIPELLPILKVFAIENITLTFDC